MEPSQPEAASVLPKVVIHADWSVRPNKRWAAAAVWQHGRYHISAPAMVGERRWLGRWRQVAGSGALLVGLDFPIGLPLAYARQVGVADFLAWLPRLGTGEWVDFYRVAESKEEITLRRPFYPQRPGGTRQQHLLAGLGVDHIDALRRRCDLPRPGRRAAAPLFWTMGAQQVGKAAICGWRELLLPALRADSKTAIWPFSGSLAALLQLANMVLAEAYPAEFYEHLGLMMGGGSKQDKAHRAAQAPALLAWAQAHKVALAGDLQVEIELGFGADPAGEDRFDAVVGVLGMVNLLLGKRPWTEPTDELTRRVEGWMLGLADMGT